MRRGHRLHQSAKVVRATQRLRAPALASVLEKTWVLEGELGCSLHLKLRPSDLGGSERKEKGEPGWVGFGSADRASQVGADVHQDSKRCQRETREQRTHMASLRPKSEG